MKEQRKTSQQGSSHQSKTQEYTPDQFTALGGHWAVCVCSMMCVMCLRGNDGVRILGNLSCVCFNCWSSSRMKMLPIGMLSLKFKTHGFFLKTHLSSKAAVKGYFVSVLDLNLTFLFKKTENKILEIQ